LHDRKVKDRASVHKLPVVAHISADSSDVLHMKYSAYFGVRLLLPTIPQGEKEQTLAYRYHC
jgi:hypothetical protein